MKREVKVGIFAVTMILMAWGGIRFLSGIDIFSRNVEYYAVYDQVSGVQEAIPVVMKGVKVGTVTAINFNPSKSEKVALVLTIKKMYRIPKNSEARVINHSLMGSKAVDIVLGDSPEYLDRGDTIPSSYAPDMISSLTSHLGPVVEKVTRLADELTTTLESVHGMVDANAANIQGLTTHLNGISANLDQILAAEKQGLQQAVHGISEFSTALGNNAERLDTLMMGLSDFSQKLARAQLVENLDSTLAELNGVLGAIRSGEGSLGKLLYDKELYAQLTQAGENLSLLLADLKAHPSRYVHFSVFGRSDSKELEREAKREAKAEAKRLKDSLKSAR